MCFVFVEARRRCGRDAGRAGAAAGGDPRETRAAQGGGRAAGRRRVTQCDRLVTDHSSRAARFTCKYRIYVTDNRDKRVFVLEMTGLFAPRRGRSRILHKSEEVGGNTRLYKISEKLQEIEKILVKVS